MTLVRATPVVLLAGSPIYSLYLRLLGARIGRNVSVECQFVPVCTDLIAIGDNTILRKDSIALGYRAQSNFIWTGPITIGRNAFVGEASVLDIDTAIGDDAQLGHVSSLQSGQRVPDGKRYHGSPAVETTVDYCSVENVPCSPLRRAVFDAAQLFVLLGVAIPAVIVALMVLERYAEPEGWLLSAVQVSIGMLVLSFLGSMFAVVVIPRLCRPFLVAGKTYSRYGLAYWLQAVVSLFSNSQFLNLLFGDSSAVVHYMRLIGWNLNTVEQTGSNFGTNQRHDNPFLCEIGSGTMVSDGLSMINMHKSASSFRLGLAHIGARNFLGNNIHYPPDGRTGANCLLATKVMIPIDGPISANVGLLGSPAFEIPRMVGRDRTLIGALTEPARRQRLRRKNVHNLETALLFLASNWLLILVTLSAWHFASTAFQQFEPLALFAGATASSLAAIGLYILFETASRNFRALEPLIATIYDPYFWFHERHWKLSDTPIMRLFPGTPFRTLILRLVGVKIGRKVFDGGCIITERSLTEIGDHANLNEGSVIQAHSLEEGVFKSDRVLIGAACTLAPAAFVHYGVTMGEHAVLEADSFLMKGETLDPHSVWRGNPARLHRRGLREAPHALLQGSGMDGNLVVAIAAE